MSPPPFVTPRVELKPTPGADIQTLPDLIEFHYKHNPEHLFCIQAEKKASPGSASTPSTLSSQQPTSSTDASGPGAGPSSELKEYDFTPISYNDLYRALRRCQSSLVESGPANAFHLPVKNHDGGISKCAPVAIIMESDAGLAIYILSLLSLGVPFVLLSTRLSAVAIRHLIQATGAKLAIVSRRLQPLMLEAFPTEVENEAEQTQQKDQEAPVTEQVSSPEIIIAKGYRDFIKVGAEDIHDAAGKPESSIVHNLHYVSEDDRNVAILHSSGSSGLPKPIYCSHRYFLGFASCHDFRSDVEAQGLTISTSPFFHGFGIVPICLSLGIGKTFCVPPSSTIATGESIAKLILESGTKALLTVPSILEEMALLPGQASLNALRQLDFAAFGGGMPKADIGEKLISEGVKIINQYGATETGPLTAFFVPAPDNNWRLLKLRTDTKDVLEVRLDDVSGQGVASSNGSSSPQKMYKLSMKPFGWSERFELQDILVTSDDMPEGSFSIAGRSDDLICLATGEKVRPTIVEDHLRRHAEVKTALAYGEGQFELIILVEPTRSIPADEIDAFRSAVWPLVEQANQEMDAHARVSSPAAILVVDPGSLPRSDKGTVPRREAAAKFAEEIAAVYEELAQGGGAVAPIDSSAPASAVRDFVAACVGRREWSDDADFFSELGMDSLQATQLQRMLAASVKISEGLVFSQLPTGFVYGHPSVDSLVKGLTTDPHHSNGDDGKSSTFERIQQLAGQYSIVPSGDKSLGRGQGHTVIITGATGSLGAHVLHQLLCDSSVRRVVCLNRLRKGGKEKESPVQRQERALTSRGLSVTGDDDGAAWASKITVYETDLAAPRLGLKEEQREELAAQATHLLHAAWPMSFKMALESFGASFRTLQNMLDLTLRAHELGSLHHDGHRPKLLFISSISTVGNYHRDSNTTGLSTEENAQQQQQEGKGGAKKDIVPETFTEDGSWCLGLGYAQAKLVCETMIRLAREAYPELQVGVVRVGQVSGSTLSGYWNPEEHLVGIFRASQALGKFPDIRGELSWLPVNWASTVLLEILFNGAPVPPVCHLENPRRQDWSPVAAALSTELGIDNTTSLVPLPEWLALLGTSPSDDTSIVPSSSPETPDKAKPVAQEPADRTSPNGTPAGISNGGASTSTSTSRWVQDNLDLARGLKDFLVRDFTRMACGSLVLDTSVAQDRSPTLRAMGTVEPVTLQAYVAYWKSIGALQ